MSLRWPMSSVKIRIENQHTEITFMIDTIGFSDLRRKTNEWQEAFGPQSFLGHTLRRRVLTSIIAAGKLGMTADEVAREMKESVLTIRPRVTELRKAKYIVENGDRRQNLSGKSAHVFVWSGRGF